MEVNPVLFDTLFPEGLFSIPPSPLIILDQPWEIITREEKILLDKILTAIRHSLNSITIIYQDSLDLSRCKVKPSKVIYFGKPVKGIPLYETVQADETAIVAAEDLKALAKNEDSRKRLWQALKKQFSV